MSQSSSHIADADRSETSFNRELICRFNEGEGSLRIDSVIEEYALIIRVNGELFRDTTCSPWDIKELVAGCLFTAGVVGSPHDLEDMEIDEEAGTANVRVSLAASSQVGGAPVIHPEAEPLLSAHKVSECIDFLEGNSRLFHRTGGVHSAVLVDRNGDLVAWFEDIGRHNALDKLAGWCFLNEENVSDKVLLFSGRIPREIIMRVISMGVPVVISPGAPTNLSIQLARDHGVTLIGFAKNGCFNVYTHVARIS